MTPEILMEVAETLGKSKAELLFDHDFAGLDPMAEQFILSGIAALEQAQAHLRLAGYFQRQALAGGRLY